MMLAVVRLKGRVNVKSDIKRTLDILGLKTKHSAKLMEDNDGNKGMLKKAVRYLAWGEADDELKEKIEGIMHLKPPKKGLKSVKLIYPAGDLGYRGETINELIKRML